jgi:hypothetical protein
VKPLQLRERVTVAVQRHDTITFEFVAVDTLDVRPFHQNDPVLFNAKRFHVLPTLGMYFYRDEGLTWVRGWDAAARDALEAAVRLQQSA